MEKIPAPRHGRHYFGTLDAADQVFAMHSQPLRSCAFAPYPRLCLLFQDDVFIEEIAEDVSGGASMDRVESAGASELISEGVELLGQLEPALAEKRSSEDYTMDGDESCHDGRRQSEIAVQEHRSTTPQTAALQLTVSSPVADDVLAIFQSCIEGDGISRNVRGNSTAAVVDPVRLRSELLEHGFTSRQCNTILTSLEEAGAKTVSLERLRSAMAPVLLEYADMIDLRHTKGEEDQPAHPGDSLDDSTVSIIRDADATLGPSQCTPDKHAPPVGCSEGASSPWKEESAIAARAESTQMDSMCLSDIAENSKEQGESTWSLSQATSAHATPQKQSAVSDDVEEKARRIAAVCKNGVWQAWRGNPHGLEPIYSISLWHQTQNLMINCGLVDVLEMLLAGVTSELVAQGQQKVPADKKLRVRLDGSIVQHSKFSKTHTLLVRRIMGILVNLALLKKGANRCRRASGEVSFGMLHPPASDLRHPPSLRVWCIFESKLISTKI